MNWTRNIFAGAIVLMVSDVMLGALGVRILVGRTQSEALMVEDGLIIPRADYLPDFGKARPVTQTVCHYWLGYRVRKSPAPAGDGYCPPITR